MSKKKETIKWFKSSFKQHWWNLLISKLDAGQVFWHFHIQLNCFRFYANLIHRYKPFFFCCVHFECGFLLVNFQEIVCILIGRCDFAHDSRVAATLTVLWHIWKCSWNILELHILSHGPYQSCSLFVEWWGLSKIWTIAFWFDCLYGNWLCLTDCVLANKENRFEFHSHPMRIHYSIISNICISLTVCFLVIQ